MDNKEKREFRTPLEIKLENKLRTLSKEQILEILKKHNILVPVPEKTTKDGLVMIPIFDIPLEELEKTLSKY